MKFMKKFENLKRYLTVTDKGIILSTQVVADVQYAFYLSTPSQVLKKYYIEDSIWEFKTKIFFNKVYYADFFYKYKGEVERYTIPFSIDKNTKEVNFLKKILVKETDGYKIDLYDQDSDTIFIVFNGYGTNKKSKPFGLEFLLSQGYNVITLLHENNQYQSLSFNDFKLTIQEYINGKKVFLYGSSLGGYAAIYYSGAVNGTVLAAAPRNSAHPKFKKANKFNDLIYTHSDIIDNPTTSKPIYIFIDDKNDEDIKFMNLFLKPAYPDLNLLVFSYAGHEVLYHVNQTKQLKKIILDIVSHKKVNIDQTLESVYTYIGKAEYFLEQNNIEKCLFYVNKCRQEKINDNFDKILCNIELNCNKLV